MGDVYKRQPLFHSFILSTQLSVVNDRLSHIMVPVSYTHLDVYKRQPVTRLVVVGEVHPSAAEDS